MAIEIDGETYRNLQEQVAYLTEELKKLKQSLGTALPDPIAGPTGPQGETGATGPQGEKGTIIYGVRTTPPQARNGDYYIEKVVENGNLNYYLNHKENGNWYRQFSMRGNQGLRGDTGSTVVANPTDTPTEDLSKISIDDVVYNLTIDDTYLDTLKETLVIDEDNNVEFGADVYCDGDLETAGDLTVGMNILCGGILKFQEHSRISAYADYVLDFDVGMSGIIYHRGIIVPSDNNMYDLGTSSNKYKDIYISGLLKDGTNSVAVADIQKLYDHKITISNTQGDSAVIHITTKTNTAWTSQGFFESSEHCILGLFAQVYSYNEGEYYNGSIVSMTDATINILASGGRFTFGTDGTFSDNVTQMN